jgi:hypothetical protein
MQIIETVPTFDATTHRMASTFTDTDQGDHILRLWDVEPIPPDDIAAALSAARACAVADNNAAAGRAREAYLTAVPGQSTTYAAKQAEADRWTAAGQPAEVEATAYPWAADRADLMGLAITDVLAEWSAVAAAWGVAGRRIERERERVNGLIGAATSLAEIQAALGSADYQNVRS